MGLDMYLIKKQKKERKNSNTWNQIGYWRKANQIHNWFVANVQKGIDNCGYYRVSCKQIQQLKEACERVVKTANLVPGEICVGYHYENGERVPIIEQGEVIINANEIAAILPTTHGFFFGHTEYDEWYLSQVRETIEILERALNETNFEEEYLVYTSSW